MPAYLDPDTLRSRANIPTTVSDLDVAALCDGIEFAITTYLEYPPASQQYTAYFDGSPSQPSLISLYPYTTAVASVYSNQSGNFQAANFTSDNLLTAGTDYTLTDLGLMRPGSLWRINNTWPLVSWRQPGRLASNLGSALGSVQVTFTSGLNPLQMKTVIEAGMLEATAVYRSWINPIGSVISDSLDGASVGINPFIFQRGNLPPFLSPVTQMRLRPFRRIPLA